MTTERNRRYLSNPGEQSPPTQRTIKEDWYSEGNVPRNFGITVEAAISSAHVCFFDCYCSKQARFTPAEMRRRGFDLKATLWSLAPKMRCQTCKRLGGIVRITRVRVSGANKGDL